MPETVLPPLKIIEIVFDQPELNEKLEIRGTDHEIVLIQSFRPPVLVHPMNEEVLFGHFHFIEQEVPYMIPIIWILTHMTFINVSRQPERAHGISQNFNGFVPIAIVFIHLSRCFFKTVFHKLRSLRCF